MKKVTIGLPVYNAEAFIGDCMRSILNQTYKDFILIIVNDGSSDKSMEIVKSFSDDRIKVIDDGENKGLPYRLNQISNITDTKYLARMDADDIMHYDRLEVQLNLLEDNNHIDVLGASAYSIDDKNVIQGLKSSDNNELVKVTSFIHPTIIGKTEWFKNNNYDEKAIRIEDAELWDRTKVSSTFYQINTPLLFYREFGGEYYKRYKKAINSFFYVSYKFLSNNNYSLSVKYFLKGLLIFPLKVTIYYIFAVCKLEDALISKRYNDVVDIHVNKDLKSSIS